MGDNFLQSRRRALLIRLLQPNTQGQSASAGTRTLESTARDFDPEILATRLENLADLLPAVEVVNREETQRTGQFMARTLRDILGKARKGDLQSLTDVEEASTEAIIIANGTRPTLLLQNGMPPLDHPMIGDWREEIGAFRDRIIASAAATCRVEPAGGTEDNYIGTGFLIDAREGLVLTNQHVLDAALREVPNSQRASGKAYRFDDGLFVEFDGEAGSQQRRRFKVVEARPTQLKGRAADEVDFERLDIAVLKIEPLPESPELPTALPLEFAAERGNGILISFCTIGYPGALYFGLGIVDGVDFDLALKQLFGGRYGVKRIAPGKVNLPIGSLPDNPQRLVFGHDATTLGGASGSPLIDWHNGNRAFGIHFAGATGISNYSHSFFAARRMLGEFGLPIG